MSFLLCTLYRRVHRGRRRLVRLIASLACCCRCRSPSGSTSMGISRTGSRRETPSGRAATNGEFSVVGRCDDPGHVALSRSHLMADGNGSTDLLSKDSVAVATDDNQRLRLPEDLSIQVVDPIANGEYDRRHITLDDLPFASPRCVENDDDVWTQVALAERDTSCTTHHKPQIG